MLNTLLNELNTRHQYLSSPEGLSEYGEHATILQREILTIIVRVQQLLLPKLPSVGSVTKEHIRARVKSEYAGVVFIETFNRIKGSRFKLIDKVNIALKLRLQTYTLNEIEQAIINCKSDPFHIENPKYLTPEFILRPDKLEMYLNYQSKEPSPSTKTGRTMNVTDGVDKMING